MSMRLLIGALAVLATAACSNEGPFDRRVNSPDEIYMSDLARELDAAGVDFRVPRDGSIVYRAKDEETVRSIEERLKKQGAGAKK